ncbi:MAG: acetylesterase [Lachnospiraceae bacterium]|nr:acetylesterase [Lachnospiraceae bacterium]
MAYYDITFRSEVNARVSNVKVELPNDTNEYEKQRAGIRHYERPMKVLYLLHGYSNDNSEWAHMTYVRDFSQRYNIAMVMPYGDLSFYLDGEGTGQKYASYIFEELPEYLNKSIGIPLEREHNYVGGCSMGGFGAIRAAYYYPEKFERAFAMSPAMLTSGLKNMMPDSRTGGADYHYYRETFGDPEKIDTSVNNPEFLLKELKRKGERITPLYMICGGRDFLLEGDRAFVRFLREQEAPVEYHEVSGPHDFTAWRDHFESCIRFLLGDEA